MTTNFLIATGAEIALLSGEHHHPDGIVVPGVVKGVDHFIHGPGPKGVEHPRPVHADRRNAILLGVDDILIRVRHSALLLL
jgi:hypothetical protein